MIRLNIQWQEIIDNYQTHKFTITLKEHYRDKKRNFDTLLKIGYQRPLQAELSLLLEQVEKKQGNAMKLETTSRKASKRKKRITGRIGPQKFADLVKEEVQQRFFNIFLYQVRVISI